MKKVGSATLIRFTEEQLTRLDALQAKSGQPLAAMIRWCVDQSLPQLEANVEKNAKQYESTIGQNLNP